MTSWLLLSAFSKLHAVTLRGNPEVSFHTIIHLWLANKKTSSNQRRANGVTAASWDIRSFTRQWLQWQTTSVLFLCCLTASSSQILILRFCRAKILGYKAHLANCMQSRSTETRRFPFIPLSISDWLIRKHHPIRDEQTAWQLILSRFKLSSWPRERKLNLKLSIFQLRRTFRVSWKLNKTR